MTNQPAPDARPNALHRRLTVALAAAPERDRLISLLGGDDGPGSGTSVVRSADLRAAAEGVAELRAADRAELRSRLEAAASRTMHDRDTAAGRLESLVAWQRTLREGATWADELVHDLTGPLGAAERARAELDDRLADHKAAIQAHQRVLEQRGAAAQAIEEADRELGDLSNMGMDESGLRRELEAAGRAVQDAREAHSAAVDRLTECNLEAAELELRFAELTGAPRGDGQRGPDSAALAAVQASLDELRRAAVVVGADKQAEALADAWVDLSADLAEHGAELSDRPSDAEVAAARAEVERTAAVAAELAASQHSALTTEERAELDGAHSAVQEAEDRAERRVGAAAARKRLTEVRAIEQELLERHGFDSYLDVVLSGGRLHVDEAGRMVAERAHLEAVQKLQALERAGAPSPELTYLESERERLRSHVVELLGVDPGPNTVELLRQHPTVPAEFVHDLVAALGRAGVHPVGTSAEDAAVAFLAEHVALLEHAEEAERSAGRRQVERAAVEARQAALEVEQAHARSEVDRTAETLQMAERSVSAFEGELSVRAGEDMTRMQRFAAAEQLRAQVEAVNASLAAAEAAAQEQVQVAAKVVAEAEAGCDRASEVVADLARRATQLAEELPIDRRPEGDPLTTLPALVTALRHHADVLQPEVDEAEAAFTAAVSQLDEATTAVRVATGGASGPEPDDLVEGFTNVLSAQSAAPLLLLDAPFDDVDADLRTQLLPVVLEHSAGRQVALFTEDPHALGWAIELPLDTAMAVPADALLSRMQRSHTVDLGAPAPAADAELVPAQRADTDTDTDTDTDSDTEPTPAPTARRWAGQR